MPRRSYQRKTCKDCGGERQDIGHVTWRGYCIECGKQRARDELDQLRAHSGPHFEYWRRRTAASVGGVLVDDLQASE